jgi:hypothetical protein
VARSPGGGKWPFAKDAPWHLMTRTTRDDARETAQWQGRERPRPLTRDEVDRRDETTEWLTFVQADARKVVVAGIAQLASGRTNIDWRRVKWQVGAEVESKGVYRRFTRAITAIVKRLNG